MEIFQIDKDIRVFYVPASSFPEGVKEAFEKLHALVPFTSTRKFFGLSQMDSDGRIQYKAAVEEVTPGEGADLGCESLVLKNGRYLTLTIQNFMKDIPAIGRAFQELLQQPGIDLNGYCVEWYFNDDDVKCMIRLEE